MIATLYFASVITYTLPQSANVTIAIDDERGRRVRNLVADAPRTAGKNVEIWDGYDDAGKPCAPGEYRWCGLKHEKIESQYLGSFYSPGDPPWRTMSRPYGYNINYTGAGGWLSDHLPPLCVASGGKDVFVGAEMAEAGCAVVRVDAVTGRKIWGTSMIALIGASAFARDGDTLFIAGEGGWTKDDFRIVRLDLNTYKFVPNPDVVARKRSGANVHQQRQSTFVQKKQGDFSGIRGMALTTDEIVVSLSDKGGRIVFFSRETAEFTRDILLPCAGQLAKAPDGTLWATFEKGIARIASSPESCEDSLNTSLLTLRVLDVVDNPRGLAIDADGNFYISDIAPERCCVKVFDSNGNHIRTIGRIGGRREGKFDPLAMGEPVSLCIDSQGLLWVAEHDFQPKRVSVWNAKTGELVRDYVGTPYYGGGGSLDVGSGVAYYDGMRFRLAPDLSGAKLDAVLFRPNEHPDVPFSDGKHNRGGPANVRKWRGRTLLVADSGYKGRPFVGEVVGDKFVPRVALCDIVKTNAVGKVKPVGVSLWQDGEYMVCEGLRADMMWASRIGADMEIVLRIPSLETDWQTDALCILRPDDNLRYDFSKMQRLKLPDALRGAIYAATISPNGKTIVVNAGKNRDRGENVIAGISAEDGRLLWTYPNPYPSNGHNSPLPNVGELRHTCGFEGWVDDVFQLNGNKGARYLFTEGGLFITELFGDNRLCPNMTSVLEVSKGTVLSGNSLCDECFGGWFGMGVEGNAMQIVGKSALAVCKVSGLETKEMLKGGKIFLDKAPPQKESVVYGSAAAPLSIMDCGGFGFQRGWQKNVTRSFPEDKVASVAFGVSRSSGKIGPLRLWVKVRDDSPWINEGEDFNLVFRTGDCIDLRWAADSTANAKRCTPTNGDIRLLITPSGVMRHTFVDHTVPKTQWQTFSSPVGTTEIAKVERIDNIKVAIEKKKDGYELIADIPWSVLGEVGPPVHGSDRRMDVGVIFGDAEGTCAVRRVYLFDSESGVVADLFSEARVNPSNWGSVKF